MDGLLSQRYSRLTKIPSPSLHIWTLELSAMLFTKTFMADTRCSSTAVDFSCLLWNVSLNRMLITQVNVKYLNLNVFANLCALVKIKLQSYHTVHKVIEFEVIFVNSS